MPSKKIKTPIEPGSTYHIYNRGNNFQKVFFSDDDYLLFLEKLIFYLSDYSVIYAFALLPNHYHLLLRVKEHDEKNGFSRNFSKFIVSYTNQINFRYKRNGSLFLNYFRRIKVEEEYYLRNLIFYIHYNPVKHSITDDFRSYKFSSYRFFRSSQTTKLARTEVLEYFGGIKEFEEYHNYKHGEEEIRNLGLEG